MRTNHRLAPANDRDPREQPSAEVIDLATRHVLPAVTQRKPRSEAMGLAAGIGIVGLLGALTLWGMDTARTAQKAVQKPLAPAGATVPAPPPALATPVLQPRPATPPAVLAAPPRTNPIVQPAVNPYAAPGVVFDASALPGQLAPTADALSGPAAQPNGRGTGAEDFASRVGGVGGSAATATASVDPKTTVTQGTLIPAVLETAIDTDVPGYARAIVSADVRSFDGSRVLVPRSSRLIGQYRSGMQAGQKRAYVIWTRLIRPDGVSVNIASPGTSFSGATGIAGKVDNHFFERFGSAMLLSVVGGLSAIGGGTTGFIIANGGQSAAAAAIGQTGQIGPTVRVRQGEPIRVFTARDLDFSKVATE